MFKIKIYGKPAEFEKEGMSDKAVLEAQEKAEKACLVILEFQTEERVAARSAAIVGKTAGVRVDVEVEVAPRFVKFKNVD